MLPDDVLLSIFDFCANETVESRSVQVWQMLVQVCQRWRSLVFGSPRGLNLQLICTDRTRVRNMLDLWPPLLLVIQSIRYLNDYPKRVDNIVALLEHRNRVSRINIKYISSSNLEKISAAMQQPFPELTYLQLERQAYGETTAVLPDSFLGGSAPHLREIRFYDIRFPGLPKLLLSATHLTDLLLFDTSHSVYFSPEGIATALSTLTSLRHLSLGFQFHLSLPDQASRRPPPPKPFVLPALTEFEFKGVIEYLEDLVIRIDAPLLKKLVILFINQILFETPQLLRFISRTSVLKAPEKARVFAYSSTATIKLSSRLGAPDYSVTILCEAANRLVSALKWVCTSCSPPLSTLEDLYIYEGPFRLLIWPDNIEDSLWLELLRPFAAVKNLYLSKEVQSLIMPFLQTLGGERTAEVLPTLQNVFLEGLKNPGPVRKAIQQFVSARQASRPIAVSSWDGCGKFY